MEQKEEDLIILQTLTKIAYPDLSRNLQID